MLDVCELLINTSNYLHSRSAVVSETVDVFPSPSAFIALLFDNNAVNDGAMLVRKKRAELRDLRSHLLLLEKNGPGEVWLEERGEREEREGKRGGRELK